jgi:hypothetical protein
MVDSGVRSGPPGRLLSGGALKTTKPPGVPGGFSKEDALGDQEHQNIMHDPYDGSLV